MQDSNNATLPSITDVARFEFIEQGVGIEDPSGFDIGQALFDGSVLPSKATLTLINQSQGTAQDFAGVLISPAR